jgi:hypothetical protein
MPISGDFYMGQYPFKTSVFIPMLPSTMLKWKTAWHFFEEVVVYNNKVREHRLTTYTPPNLWSSSEYYIFKSKDDLNSYRLGQSLHVKAYPTVDWAEPAHI